MNKPPLETLVHEILYPELFKPQSDLNLIRLILMFWSLYRVDMFINASLPVRFHVNLLMVQKLTGC